VYTGHHKTPKDGVRSAGERLETEKDQMTFFEESSINKLRIEKERDNNKNKNLEQEILLQLCFW